LNKMKDGGKLKTGSTPPPFSSFTGDQKRNLWRKVRDDWNRVENQSLEKAEPRGPEEPCQNNRKKATRLSSQNNRGGEKERNEEEKWFDCLIPRLGGEHWYLGWIFTTRSQHN